MSFIRIWLHCVWATKNRVSYLQDEIRYPLIQHIFENAKAKNIHIDHLNGSYEHLHALISMSGTQNISEIIHLIKGESSYWINKCHLTKKKFEWQDDFYCVSIGVPQVDYIRKYIKNQEGHHSIISWDEEIDTLIKENQLQIIKD